jgi:hypothetical protein
MFMPVQCSKPVKVVVDGKSYCAIHNPDAVAKRKQKQRDKWDAQDRAYAKRRAIESAKAEVIAAAREWSKSDEFTSADGLKVLFAAVKRLEDAEGAE